MKFYALKKFVNLNEDQKKFVSNNKKKGKQNLCANLSFLRLLNKKFYFPNFNAKTKISH